MLSWRVPRQVGHHVLSENNYYIPAKATTSDNTRHIGRPVCEKDIMSVCRQHNSRYIHNTTQVRGFAMMDTPHFLPRASAEWSSPVPTPGNNEEKRAVKSHDAHPLNVQVCSCRQETSSVRCPKHDDRPSKQVLSSPLAPFETRGRNVTICPANISCYHSNTFSITEMLSAYYTL
jgi:hypothetical protein